jgi:hypothetical protein
MTVYIARNRAMKVPIVIQMSEQRATRNALLDSGATESFIHP